MNATTTPTRPLAPSAPMPAVSGRMTLVQACAELTSGTVTRYVPPADLCGCGRCGR